MLLPILSLSVVDATHVVDVVAVALVVAFVIAVGTSNRTTTAATACIGCWLLLLSL